MNIISVFIAITVSLATSSKTGDDHPTLPSMWSADTIEPGSPGNGKGIESYNFISTPTPDNPSAMWSNYTDCQRLIYVPNSYDGKRYLLGCDAVNCCYEPQDSNQVEFQIPNVHYSNPNKKVEVSYQRTNITNFGEELFADEWSWSWTVKDILSQEWKAYTNDCDDCVNGVELIQWASRAMDSPWYTIEFRNYKGYDLGTDEGKVFHDTFAIPDICKKNNLLECPSGLHAKYFGEDVYQPIKYVDLSMYSGRWYQVYENYFDITFQGKGTCSVADYTIIGDKVGVLNSQIDKNGKLDQIGGNAFYEDNNSGGELSVKLDGVPRTAPYWIIELGPIVNNKYEYSIVSDNKRITLFVLARNVEDFYNKYDDEVKEKLKKLGFNKKLNEPIKMEQNDCDYTLYDNNLLTNTEKCCNTCPEGQDKYYSIPILSKDHCGESCIKPEDYNKYHLLEPKLTKATSNTPCLDMGYSYENTQEHGFGPVKIAVDMYKQNELKSSNCGTCGTAYQSCCIGFAIDGYPCDCHLQDSGSGKAGSDCGDCGTGFSACCIGYAADGYPCECDVM